MKYAPSDRDRGEDMKRAALNSYERGDGFHFIGFSWESHASAPDRRDAELLLSGSYPISHRAIVHVEKTKKGFDTLIVEVGGDENVYAYSYDITKDLGWWRKLPASQAVLDMMFLRREYEIIHR